MGLLTTYRKRAGLSQSALAEKAGTSQPQIQRLEKGTRGLSKKWATKIAPIVKAFPEELMFGDRTVPVVGIVSAGEAHFGTETDGDLGLARMPRGGTEETVAVEVRGDSLGGAFDGWLIYYDQRREPPTDDLLGNLCVVGLQSGQVLVKLLMRGRIPGHYDLFSGSGSGVPLTDQAVIWAARVAGIMPPLLARVEFAADSPQQGAKSRRRPRRPKHR
jgi:DNA-binding XRE family transcriptional regulator